MTTNSPADDQIQVLRDQIITLDQPGTVLQDFRTLVNFIGPKGIEAGGKYHLLPIKIIGELDELLSHPLHLELKRPQIRSHPYIQGLNLLLRATGLAQIQKSGAKARLVLDQSLLVQWHQLNPTEQYFQLLEAWLLIGRAEMVGERGSAMGGELLWDCFRGWNTLPKKGFRLGTQQPSRQHVPGFYGNYYVLALMDLFGLVQVEHTSKPATPWMPARVQRTPFGEAVFTLLFSAHLDSMDQAQDEETEDDDATEDDGTIDVPSFGTWQPLFQPYFPEWQQNLELPEPELRTGEFIFRVGLGKIWRRIAMPADETLSDLMNLILRSVNFNSDHLYEFRYINRLGAVVSANSPWTDEGPYADEITIGSLPLDAGQEMNATYDFGDSWMFKVKLERIEPASPKAEKARILESHGEAPEQYPNWDE